MAITLTELNPGTTPEAAVCSAGRWVSHDEWPGWQAECAEPGAVCPVPPYVLCAWHAWDLAERSAQALWEGIS